MTDKTPAEVAARRIGTTFVVTSRETNKIVRVIPPMARIIEEAYAEQTARIAELEIENGGLKAAICTPMIYAGVISRVVEGERDALVRRVAELETVGTEMLLELECYGSEEYLDNQERWGAAIAKETKG